MQVNVLKREETYRIRHFSLDLSVEEKGKLYPLNITLIENYDVRANSHRYEVECVSCKKMTGKKDLADLEMKLEEYLIDNAVDVLSRKLQVKENKQKSAPIVNYDSNCQVPLST